MDQVHRVTRIIDQAFEEKKFCPAVFIDVSQAFDCVWQEGLLFKLSGILPGNYCKLLKSYLEERTFCVTFNTATTEKCLIKAGVPQGSVIGPLLYLLYTYDLPIQENVTTAMFADDTAILSVNKSHAVATDNLQHSINKIALWCQKWKIKLNQAKSVHVNFTLRKYRFEPITMNGQILPESDHAKYLGMYLDSRLNWKHHVRKKRAEMDIKLRKMYWLLGWNSKLSLYNKRLVYVTILKPIWTYGVQL